MELMISLFMPVARNSWNICVSALIQINHDSKYMVTLEYETFGMKSIQSESGP
jgi:hypothetical protein